MGRGGAFDLRRCPHRVAANVENNKAARAFLVPIMVLRILPPLLWTRSWNQTLSAEVGWPPLGDPLTPKLVLVAAGPQVELGQNIAPCVGGALVRR